MMAETVHSGGCQCGAVRYRARGKLGYPHLCHCRMCQKAAGNYFMPLAAVMRSSFELSRGEPNWFHSSDVVRRGFCGICGTPLFYEMPDADFINITLGSLDDPNAARPVMQSNTASRMTWFHELPGLPVEPVLEPAARDDAIARSNRQHPDHDTETWPPERPHD